MKIKADFEFFSKNILACSTDVDRAVVYFQKGAVKGSPAALYMLGYALTDRGGSWQDESKTA